jgi:hypothetical protein
VDDRGAVGEEGVGHELEQLLAVAHMIQRKLARFALG